MTKKKKVIQVLIVDDMPLIRKAVANILRDFFKDLQLDAELSICEAKTAEAALLVMAHKKVEIIISDVTMPPGMNGFELLKEVVRLDEDFLKKGSFIVMSTIDTLPYYTQSKDLGGIFVRKDDTERFSEVLEIAFEKLLKQCLFAKTREVHEIGCTQTNKRGVMQ